MRSKPEGFSIRLSDEEKRRLDELANDLGVARADVFRTLLKRAIITPTVSLIEDPETVNVAK